MRRLEHQHHKAFKCILVVKQNIISINEVIAVFILICSQIKSHVINQEKLILKRSTMKDLFTELKHSCYCGVQLIS